MQMSCCCCWKERSQKQSSSFSSSSSSSTLNDSIGGGDAYDDDGDGMKREAINGQFMQIPNGGQFSSFFNFLFHFLLGIATTTTTESIRFAWSSPPKPNVIIFPLNKKTLEPRTFAPQFIITDWYYYQHSQLSRRILISLSFSFLSFNAAKERERKKKTV